MIVSIAQACLGSYQPAIVWVFLKYSGGLKSTPSILVCNSILSLEGRLHHVMNLEKKNRRIPRNH